MDKFWNGIEKCLYIIIYKILRIKLSKKIFLQFTQFIKFGIVGVSNTVISYVVYVLLLIVGMNYIVASIIGFIVSVINAFYWNNAYVFKGTEVHILWKTFLKTFISYAGTGLILSNVLLGMWVNLFQVDAMVAPIINIFITTPLNFIINKLWAFRNKS